ncbi:unnamed protein product [Alopecurus aequalis]
MDKNNNGSWDLPTDALVEILARVPPNARRRLRVFCRHWRELIDQRTDMRSRTKIIVVTENGLVTVVDLLTCASNLLWQTDFDTAIRYSRMSIIGSCNGLVCLCDDLTPGGVITVANPSTGETLPLPPLPMPSANNDGRSRHQTYGFAYHHTTGQYKVVHAPCDLEQPDIVHVFTLGEASWRDVHTEIDARCSLCSSSSLTDVDGTMYWLLEDTGKIMSFNLKHEHVTRTEPLPVTEMLGVAVGGNDSVTVWVLEGERWSRRYILELDMLQQNKKMLMRWDLVVPHLVHGNYFLSLSRETWSPHFVLYRHGMDDETLMSQDGVVHIRHMDHGEEVTCFSSFIYQTFSYVETKEPLNPYGVVLVHNLW